MNRIYKLKFDKRRNVLVVVSEIASGVGKTKATGNVEGETTSRRGGWILALSLLSGMMMASPVMAAGLPTGGQIVAGSGTIQSPSSNQMNIHQDSQSMVANWNSFNIGKGNTVQFYQPDSSAVALNRVVGGGESHIMGNLQANGQVFLVNPNGVLFGKDSSVNTAGFVASTRDIKNEDFMNRRYTFSGDQTQGAAIVNQGTLTTNAGGYIVLAADKVINSGTIRTPGGKAVLAAGERVTLQLDNGGLTSVQVSGEVVNALVENSGLISARNGQVYLTARGRDMLMNTVLNVSGVVEAGGMHHQNGDIVLDGGDSGVVHLSGTLQADNATGKGGKVVVQGKNILLDNGSSITAVGSHGGGEVYVGGGWQGKDSRIKNADKVVMLKGAHIDVSATQQGNGGTAVLWSDNFTGFHGQINAKGGEHGGNGGQVETSSHAILDAFGVVNASAKNGKAGNWLLDPEDITIVNGSDNNVNNQTVNGTNVFTPTGTNSRVSNGTINNQLNNGTSVTIQTSSSSGATQMGNITVDADINKTSGSDATLTLVADGNINIRNGKNITSTAGKLNLNLSAANTSNGTISISDGVTINTNGGNFTAGTANVSNTVNISVGSRASSNVNLTTGTGDISMTGDRIQLKGSNVTAGNLRLNGTGTVGVQDSSTVNVTDNITMNSINNNVYLSTASLTAQNGSITIEGTGGGKAIEIRDGNTLTANNGSIILTGSGSDLGVQIYKNNTLNAANINITGSTIGNLHGVHITTANAITASNGNLMVTGSATKGAGVHISERTSMTASNGDIIVTGSSTDNHGVYFQNDNSAITASQGNISITGTSQSRHGVALWGPTTLTAKNIAVDGSSFYNGPVDNVAGSSRGTGVALGGSQVFNGDTSISGSAVNGDGVVVGSPTEKAADISFTNGSATIVGSSINGTGVANANGILTGVDVSGSSVNGPGVEISGDSTLNDVTVDGSSDNGSGVNISGNLTSKDGSTIAGSSNNGSGVKVEDAIVSGSAISGSSVNGSGVEISGDSTLNSTTVDGSSDNGYSVTINGNLTNDDNTVITANPNENGLGINISGSVTGGSVTDLNVKDDGDVSPPALPPQNEGYPLVVVKHPHQQNQAVMGDVRAKWAGPDTSGVRSAPQTVTISVCNEDENCTSSEL